LITEIKEIEITEINVMFDHRNSASSSDVMNFVHE